MKNETIKLAVTGNRECIKSEREKAQAMPEPAQARTTLPTLMLLSAWMSRTWSVFEN